MTPFRDSQARLAIEGLVRALGPNMAKGHLALRDVMREVVRDERLWVELNHGQPLPPPPTTLAEALNG